MMMMMIMITIMTMTAAKVMAPVVVFLAAILREECGGNSCLSLRGQLHREESTTPVCWNALSCEGAFAVTVTQKEKTQDQTRDQEAGGTYPAAPFLFWCVPPHLCSGPVERPQTTLANGEA